MKLFWTYLSNNWLHVLDIRGCVQFTHCTRDLLLHLLSTYAIPKIKILCDLHCLKAKLRLPCNKYQQLSSLNLISQQLKFCNILIFGMAYWYIAKVSLQRDLRSNVTTSAT